MSRLEREKSRRGVSSIGPPIHAQGTSEESVAPRDHAARQHLHKIEELSRFVALLVAVCSYYCDVTLVFVTS